MHSPICTCAQEAMERALCERDFDSKLISLLIDYGAKASSIDMARLSERATEDPYMVLNEIKQVPTYFCHASSLRLLFTSCIL